MNIDGTVYLETDDVGTEDAEKRIFRNRDFNVRNLPEQISESLFLVESELIRMGQIFPIFPHEPRQTYFLVLLEGVVNGNADII